MPVLRINDQSIERQKSQIKSKPPKLQTKYAFIEDNNNQTKYQYVERLMSICKIHRVPEVGRKAVSTLRKQPRRNRHAVPV